MLSVIPPERMTDTASGVSGASSIVRRETITASWRASVLPKRRLPLLPMRGRSAIVFLFAMLTMAAPAFAHPVPFSYLDVQLGPQAVDVSLVAHIFDLAHDLQIAPPERLLDPSLATERAKAMEAMLTPRLQVTADGKVLQGEWTGVEILRERQSLRFH